MTENSIERRHEPRTKIDLSVRVWGIDAQGERFLRDDRRRSQPERCPAVASEGRDARIGDVVGVSYAGKSARYKVIWMRDCGPEKGIQAAVQRMATDECPWRERLMEAKAHAASGATHLAGPSPAGRT